MAQGISNKIVKAEGQGKMSIPHRNLGPATGGKRGSLPADRTNPALNPHLRKASFASGLDKSLGF